MPVPVPPSRPDDAAWLWHLTTPVDTLLTRREGAVLDLLGRAGPRGMATPLILSAILDAAPTAARLESRAPEPVSKLRVATFYDVLSNLEAKGYVETLGVAGTTGRPAKVLALTDLGEHAAEFARHVSDHVIEVGEATAIARERGGTDLLTLLVDTRSEHAVLTSDGGGYRVDKVDVSRYLTISEGPPQKHAAILAWLRDQAGITDAAHQVGEGSFVFVPTGGDDRSFEISVRITPEVVGYRTSIGLRRVPPAQASSDA